MIPVGKRELLWSYLSQFLSVANGLIVLPMVLRVLSPEEVGLNYIMLSIGALVFIFDGGFGPLLIRNVSYVFAGARHLQKEGFSAEHMPDGQIDYKLLANLIHSARWIYSLVSSVVVLPLLSLGTWYIYNLTDGFTIIPNALAIWIAFVVSISLQLYYAYYSHLLFGSGKVIRSRQTVVLSQATKIVLSYIVLSLGWGLLGLTLVAIISALVIRFSSHAFFYTKEIRLQLKPWKVNLEEKKELLSILWYNGRKIIVLSFCGYLVSQVSVMFVGSYLSLEVAASFGLMVQLLSVLRSFSGVVLITSIPFLTSILVKGDSELFKRKFSMSMVVHYVLFGAGVLILSLWGEVFLNKIGANIHLPEMSVMLVFGAFRLLEYNFWEISQYYTMQNRYPYVKSILMSGLVMTALQYLCLEHTEFGLWGLVLVTGITQLLFLDWYWPLKILTEIRMNVFSFLKMGFTEIYFKAKRI